MRRRTGKFALTSLVACTLVVPGGSSSALTSSPGVGWENSANRTTYLGLSYSPSWHRIGSFAIGANDGSTAAIYPNLLDTETPRSSSFNWGVQDPNIRFEDNTTWGMEGSVGYKRNATRVELEVGYQRFETREVKLDKSAGGTETMYLLAKSLAHGVVSGNSEQLGKSLAETSAQDVMTFAQAVGQEAESIDKKVCRKRIAALAFTSSWLNGGMWSCNDHNTHRTFSPRVWGSLSSRFGKPAWHYPMQEDRGAYQTNRGWPGTSEWKINTAQGMAGDLVNNLDRDERETIARIFTKVTGAEVIQIRAVTTASVMLNACYDLTRNGLTPFACLGLGANLVSITDGHLDAKLAAKLKVGLNYEITPRVTAFVSGFYHHVLGNGEYHDVPVQHLLDDQSPEGRSKNYAVAKFKMAYTGTEVGMRFGF